MSLLRRRAVRTAEPRGPDRSKGSADGPVRFPAEPGDVGQLEFRADIDGCGRISHAGEYRYIGEVGGMLAFVETVDPPVYLAPDEVLGFRVTGR